MKTSTSMKSTLALAAVGLSLMTATSAMAAPKHYGKNDHRGHVSYSERAAISKARTNLAVVKRKAYADGRLTMFERMRIRTAENRLQRAIRNARS